jgi:hypothetical protein
MYAAMIAEVVILAWLMADVPLAASRGLNLRRASDSDVSP